MKTISRTFPEILIIVGAIIVLLSFAAHVPGCGQTPRKQAAESTAVVTASIDTLSAAVDAGVITKAQGRELLPYVDAVVAAQAIANEAAKSGDPNLIKTAGEAVTAATKAFAAQYQAAKAGQPIVPLPTTRP
jgi:NADH:ubiquinone oxidoreductase subunit 6 (subunit J)